MDFPLIAGITRKPRQRSVTKTNEPSRRRKFSPQKEILLSDEASGLYVLRDLEAGSVPAAKALATVWAGSTFTERPRGLYAVYYNEVYGVIRDAFMPASLNIGAHVLVLTGLDKQRLGRIFAVVESKCRFISLQTTFDGRLEDKDSPDGFYQILASEEDFATEKSPVRPISCVNFRTNTELEQFAAKALSAVVHTPN